MTGSARADALAAGWPATGRVVRVSQWPLSRREIDGNIGARSFFDDVFDADLGALRGPTEPTGLRGYVDVALLGGFPEVVLQGSARLRRVWLDSSIEQLLTRDAALVDTDRDPRRLRRYLRALAANTAGVVGHKTVYDAAGISHATAQAYDGLLDLLMVTEQLPAWAASRLDRLARTPKRYLTDPSLLVPLLNVDARAVLRDGDLVGRLIDTFVVAQLRPEAAVADVPVSLAHLRTQNGRQEIDLVAERADGRLVAMEIKAAAAVNVADARYLAWLRDRRGDDFVAGIVFHTGPHGYRLAERIWALPIAAIWSRSSG